MRREIAMLLRVLSTWVSSSPSMDFGVYGWDCDDGGFVMGVWIWGLILGSVGALRGTKAEV